MDTRETSTLRPLKTWSHLAARRRRPTEYETVSTNLLWSTQDPDRPWTMGQAIPMSGWFKRYRNESPLQHADWDGFRDPDQLIYRNYTLIQDGQEAFVDGLLDEHQRNDHDESLPQAWLEVLGSHWAPARYVVHAQQMSSNYLVALAPSSTIVNCFMLQGGDQLRWVSRIAYRTAALRKRQKELEDTVTERTAEVVQQKELVEEKQKEILDSIYYARRIQTALMPSEIYFEKVMRRLRKISRD